MKKIASLIVLMTSAIILVSFCKKDPSSTDGQEYSGPYFGQDPPGRTPSRFVSQMIPAGAFAITFSPDGKECFYTKYISSRSVNAIYWTKEQSGSWGMPEIASFSGRHMDMEAHIIPDGSRMYFGSERPLSGSPTGILRSWYLEKEESGWSEPQPIESPLRDLSMMFPSVAANGNIYYTAVDGMDQCISMSKYVNGAFQPPEILSNNINSHRATGHPFIAPDESYIIFDAVVASNYFRDLYISFRNLDGSWTQAVSMGDAVNTSENEMCAFVSRNGEYLFFYRGGEGSDGVYWVDADIIEDLK